MTSNLLMPDDFKEWCKTLPAVARTKLSIHDLRQIYEGESLRQRLVISLRLLGDAWDPVEMRYDVQGVNQAHRVLAGGDLPRETKCD